MTLRIGSPSTFLPPFVFPCWWAFNLHKNWKENFLPGQRLMYLVCPQNGPTHPYLTNNAILIREGEILFLPGVRIILSQRPVGVLMVIIPEFNAILWQVCWTCLPVVGFSTGRLPTSPSQPPLGSSLVHKERKHICR